MEHGIWLLARCAQGPPPGVSPYCRGRPVQQRLATGPEPSSPCQGADNVTDTMWGGLDELSARLADFYRDLHQHPELSLQEHRTAQRVAEGLRTQGFEVTGQVGGTGVVGLLRNGDGPVVMLRADFDALPIQEETGLPYASTVRATDGEGREV